MFSIFQIYRSETLADSFVNVSSPGPVHTTMEEFENGGFTLKMHQIFFVHFGFISTVDPTAEIKLGF